MLVGPRTTAQCVQALRRHCIGSYKIQLPYDHEHDGLIFFISGCSLEMNNIRNICEAK